tara:strand:+ start:710 stop:1156 length:447 start_codon:yes stop_codon:yes gene_type:complete
MRIILIILLFFTTQCGYSPIYLKNDINFPEFKEVILEGNQDLSNQVINSLSLKRNNENKALNELYLKTFYKIDETSKNSKGQVQSYRSTISLNLEISKNGEIIKNRMFKKEFSYSSKNNKFDLVQYQDEIKNNLIKEIIEEIILFLNS